MGSFSVVGTSASAASITATPDKQTLVGTPQRAYWNLNWSGTKEFYVYYRHHTGANYQTVLGNTSNTALSNWYYTYDIGADPNKTWYGTFRVVDYYGNAATKSVTVAQSRY